MLLAEHSGALLSQALVAAAAAAAAVTQLLGAAEGVTVRSVLAELGPLQAVLLIEADVVEGLAVAVSGRLRLPARRCLRVKNNTSNIKRIKRCASKCGHTKTLFLTAPIERFTRP